MKPSEEVTRAERVAIMVVCATAARIRPRNIVTATRNCLACGT